MKLKQLIHTACATLASLLFLASSARATLPYANGDFILGFRATGGAGATTCYEVNLGNATVFDTASGLVTPNIGDIKTDLDNIYGVGWSSRADVYWSVSAVVRPAANGFPNNTMFATREEPSVGTQSTPWPRPSAFAVGAPTNAMVVMVGAASGYAAGTNATAGQIESTNSSVGLIQSTTSQSCYAAFQPGGAQSGATTAFGYFQNANGIEGTFANGTAGTMLDLYKVVPGAGASELRGTFTISAAGVVTFTPPGGAPTANVHFSATTYSGAEDIAGGQIAVTVTRDGDTTSAASVNFSTANGTALDGTDFTGQTNTPVNFAAAATSKQVMVDVIDRAGFQGDRSFTVNLSGAGAGTTITTPSSATVTIIETDPNAGALAFTSATYTAPEVDAQSAFSLVPVTFTRTNGTMGAVSASLAVTGGSLTNGTDYNTIANPTAVDFADGATSATVNIQLKAIAPGSLPGTIILGLSNPTNGASLGAQTTATVTINPVTANVHFSSQTYSGSEASGQIAINITRDGNTAKPFTVNFSTVNASAIAGTDFTGQTNAPVSFAAGDLTKTVMVDVVDRPAFQGSRAFGVNLTSPSTGATVNAPTTASVTITDDEVAPAGTIAFSAATVQANALNGTNTPNSVVLILNRTSGTAGAVAVDVSVTGGTLVNGTDYNTIANPTTVNFANGVATGTVTIQLKTIAPASLPGTIVLGLSNPTNGANLGAQTTTTVTIISPGLLAFSAGTFQFNPVDSQAAPNLLPITLTRSSGQNGAVAVSVSVTGGTLAAGTDFTFTSPTIVNFADGVTTATVNIQLNAIASAKLPGNFILGLTNPTGGAALGAQTITLVKIAKPDLGKPTVTVSSPLTGSIVTTPFTLTGKAIDAKGIDRVEVSLNKGPVQFATLGTPVNGKVTFTLAGIQPENGKNTLVVTAVDSSGNKSLPFVVVVTYLNNRPALAGGYNGLLVPAGTPSNNVSGFLKLTVTKTGNFTGTVTLGGFNLPISGVVGNDGKAHFKPKLLTALVLTGKPAAPAAPVALGSLELTVAEDATLGAKATGTLSDATPAVIANLSAPRNFFNGLTPATTVNSSYTLTNKGKFTLILPAKAQGPLDPSLFPQGDGYANLTLTAAGSVKAVGKTADGAAFTASAKLASDYSWPFYAAIAAAKGSLAGVVTFDDSQADSDLTGTNLLWFRAAKPASKYYPAGWTAGLQIDLLGAKYVKSNVASVLPSLGAADPTNGNAALVFADGKLNPTPLNKNVNISIANVATNAPLSDKSFNLVIAKGSGQISGNFKHSDNTKPLYTGIILQKGLNAGGYGFFLSTVPATVGATGESGGVSLSAK